MNRNIALRVVSGLVLFAVIAAIGFFAFQAGVAQGSPITIEAPSGESAPAPYPHYGYGYGMRPHHPFGFGFGCLFPIFGILLFILAFKSFRVMMWGPRWGWEVVMVGASMASRRCSMNGTRKRMANRRKKRKNNRIIPSLRATKWRSNLPHCVGDCFGGRTSPRNDGNAL